ncbi:DNA replication/repair protein RecF [Aureibaculum algae]|uniref:DNA replication and repair protein RecF n=1 Tax=Aureibaculum algae TaxID=2584122 RepID=A0A5B7TUI2_9FLAO|nr:DNA replication/repair protein RecF [Aureibaculum algae]QCX38292.1 DNA replication/repair protein RecF [Aureibaculum algae]
MYLKKISLVNYKNFEAEAFEFNTKINCFVGYNGVGKTNVLDAIYHLAFTKGYFNSIASQNIQHEKEFFVVEGLFNLDEREELINCSFKKGQKKVVKRNGKDYEKLSEHIGLIPVVIISPNDTNLISEGSDVRRKFMDSVIAQSDKNYLQDLISYNKVLSQRNALLKYFASNHTFDALNIDVYNKQLIDFGDRIYKKRKSFAEDFAPILERRHKHISSEGENVSFKYKSQLEKTDFEELLKKSLEKDRVLQYTSVGIQRDDLLYSIEEYPIKKFGSQGQQKTYLIALKLAEFDFIQMQSKKTPILLLDDIFDKLDENRVSKIVDLVNDDNFGQIFITDTHAERTENVIKKTNQPYKMFELN